MRRILVLLLASLATTAAHAEMYKVTISRIDANIYKTSDGFYIATKYCYEFVTSGDAVLRYTQFSFDNKLIFDSGTTCDVDKVFK